MRDSLFLWVKEGLLEELLRWALKNGENFGVIRVGNELKIASTVPSVLSCGKGGQFDTDDPGTSTHSHVCTHIHIYVHICLYTCVYVFLCVLICSVVSDSFITLLLLL